VHHSLGIPSLLEFEALPLHGLSMEHVGDVDGKRHELSRWFDEKD
jgi:hypothetical protein